LRRNQVNTILYCQVLKKLEETINSNVQTIIEEIIQDAVLQANNITSRKVTLDNKDPESDDEDDYFKIIEQRRMIQENRIEGKSSIVGSINEKFRNEKVGNKLSESAKIRVYFFGTQNFYDYLVHFGDTFLDLKQKILGFLDGTPSFLEKCGVKLKFTNPEAFEIRFAEDDEDDVFPNLEFGACEDNLGVLMSKNYVVCFVIKKNYNEELDRAMKVLGTSMRNAEIKITLKIYFKINDGAKSTIIEEYPDKTLRDLLERIYEKKHRLPHKNFDYYFFCEHQEDEEETEDMNDIDNEINMDTQLKYLNVLELDVSKLLYICLVVL